MQDFKVIRPVKTSRLNCVGEHLSVSEAVYHVASSWFVSVHFQKVLSLMADFAYPKFEEYVSKVQSTLELTDEQR